MISIGKIMVLKNSVEIMDFIYDIEKMSMGI